MARPGVAARRLAAQSASSAPVFFARPRKANMMTIGATQRYRAWPRAPRASGCRACGRRGAGGTRPSSGSGRRRRRPRASSCPRRAGSATWSSCGVSWSSVRDVAAACRLAGRGELGDRLLGPRSRAELARTPRARRAAARGRARAGARGGAARRTPAGCGPARTRPACARGARAPRSKHASNSSSAASRPATARGAGERPRLALRLRPRRRTRQQRPRPRRAARAAGTPRRGPAPARGRRRRSAIACQRVALLEVALERLVGPPEAELEVAERLHRPRRRRGPLRAPRTAPWPRRVRAALRLPPLRRLEPREAGERRGELASLARSRARAGSPRRSSPRRQRHRSVVAWSRARKCRSDRAARRRRVGCGACSSATREQARGPPRPRGATAGRAPPSEQPRIVAEPGRRLEDLDRRGEPRRPRPRRCPATTSAIACAIAAKNVARSGSPGSRRARRPAAPRPFIGAVAGVEAARAPPPRASDGELADRSVRAARPPRR